MNGLSFRQELRCIQVCTVCRQARDDTTRQILHEHPPGVLRYARCCCCGQLVDDPSDLNYRRRWQRREQLQRVADAVFGKDGPDAPDRR